MGQQYVEIAFRQAGELFLFDAGEFSLKQDDRVVVETEHGQALGTVKSLVSPEAQPPVNFQLYRVVRLASGDDLGREQRHKHKESEAFEYCNQKIRELNLPMKLIQTEYFFSGSKLLFYFSAEGRVDFRLLVRDLARYFQKRIEMRQIGVRDSAKLLGGIGPCGQQLCCNRFLRQFNPVSIRMAKEQNLPLNPQKVSGVCGRLMCCLSYEQGLYQAMRKRLPRVGEDVETSQGTGKVREVYPIQERVRVIYLDREPPVEEDIHIKDLPAFRELPQPEFVPVLPGGKNEKGAKGKNKVRRGLEPLMEPKQMGRGTNKRREDSFPVDEEPAVEELFAFEDGGQEAGASGHKGKKPRKESHPQPPAPEPAEAPSFEEEEERALHETPEEASDSAELPKAASQSDRYGQDGFDGQEEEQDDSTDSSQPQRTSPQPRDGREQRNPRHPRDGRDAREQRNQRDGHRNSRDNRVQRDSRDNQNNRDNRRRRPRGQGPALGEIGTSSASENAGNTRVVGKPVARGDEGGTDSGNSGNRRREHSRRDLPAVTGEQQPNVTKQGAGNEGDRSEQNGQKKKRRGRPPWRRKKDNSPKGSSSD